MVGKTLNWRDGDNGYLIISRCINDDFVVLIKGVEQDPDMGVKMFHPSIDDDSEATDSDEEKNIDESAPQTPYDDEILNASSNDEVNNDEDAPKTPYHGENVNSYYNNEVNIYEVSPNPPTYE